MTDETKFDAWCIVEVMGHSRFAGRTTEQQIGGASFVRVDVPESAGRAAFTKLFAPGAIFSITPVSEDLAREACESFTSRPFATYILPLYPPGDRGEGDYSEDDDDLA
jgi:hypothetical protein